jgi:hypothetical protein
VPFVDQISVVFCINEGTEKDKEITPAPVFLTSLQVAQCTSFGIGAQPVKNFTKSESKKHLENDLLSKNHLAEHSNTILLILPFYFFSVRERER